MKLLQPFMCIFLKNQAVLQTLSLPQLITPQAEGCRSGGGGSVHSGFTVKGDSPVLSLKEGTWYLSSLAAAMLGTAVSKAKGRK